MAMRLHFLKNQFTLVILLIFFSISISSSTQDVNFSIAKPNCTDHCGNVSIPFPFGTTEDCYLSESFFVTCDDTHYDPPKAFLGTINITSISLEGQLRVLQYIAKDCYYPNGTSLVSNDPWIEIPQYLTVNNTANKFTVVGCDTRGFVFGNRLDRDYTTGCSSLCASEDDLVDGSCSGVGCCQTSIPKNVWRIQINLESFHQYENYDNRGNTWVFNSCSYAFVVEETSFSFSPSNLSLLSNVTMLPMVLDWAIGNGTCEDAKKNLSSYACKSENSECLKPNNGDGYRCNCLKGYRGHPYLLGGCRDIDECQDPSLHDCEKDRCVNTEGSFQCVCPKGYQGEGKSTYGRGCVRIRGESITLKLVAGIAIGVSVLLLASCLLYLELNRRKLVRMKQLAAQLNLMQLQMNTMQTSMLAQFQYQNEFTAVIAFMFPDLTFPQPPDHATLSAIPRDDADDVEDT